MSKQEIYQNRFYSSRKSLVIWSLTIFTVVAIAIVIIRVLSIIGKVEVLKSRTNHYHLGAGTYGIWLDRLDPYNVTGHWAEASGCIKTPEICQSFPIAGGHFFWVAWHRYPTVQGRREAQFSEEMHFN